MVQFSLSGSTYKTKDDQMYRQERTRLIESVYFENQPLADFIATLAAFEETHVDTSIYVEMEQYSDTSFLWVDGWVRVEPDAALTKAYEKKCELLAKIAAREAAQAAREKARADRAKAKARREADARELREYERLRRKFGDI